MRSRLRNLGVTARLTGAFVLVCVLILVLGWIAIGGLFSVQRRYAEAVRDLSWTRVALSAKGDLLEEVRAQKNYVLRGEEQYLRLARQHGQEFDRDLMELRAFPMGKEERETLRALASEVAALRESFERVPALRARGGVAAADAEMRGKAATAVATLDVQVAAAAARAKAAAETASKETYRTHNRAAALVIAIGLVAILLGIALSLSITRPVARLRGAVQAVGAGQPIESGPASWFHDELGEVGDAFRELVNRASLLRDMEARTRRLEALSARVVQAQESERARIARELHDGLGQALTAIKFELSAAATAAAARADTVTDRLASARDLTAQCLEEVRRLAHDLRPPSLDNIGLPAALRSYARQAEEWLPARIIVVEHNVSARLPARVETALYRVAQEALANVAKHAYASHVWIELSCDDATVTLRIRDDGRGMDLAALSKETRPDSGLGLLSMAHRAQELGGSFRIESAPGKGTAIQVQVPISEGR